MKLWSSKGESFKGIGHGFINPLIEDKEQIKRNILQNEGGILIDLSLICCKSLETIAREGGSFQTRDGLIIGCPQGGYDMPKKFLPDHFILPYEVFTPSFSPSELYGVCFKRFHLLSELNNKMEEIHSSLYKLKEQEKKVTTKLIKIRYLLASCMVLLIATVFIFTRYFDLLKIVLFATLITCLVFVSLIFLPIGEKKDYLKSAHSHFNTFFHWEEYLINLKETDKQRLNKYQNMFERFFQRPHLASDAQIPKTIHFIWGGQPLPEKSIKNIESWIKCHPGWVFKFWTDDPSRPLPAAGMEKHLMSEITESSRIKPYFEEAKNWGEKSDLLRYEILFREGGVYVDHDVECMSSFEFLHETSSFYASLEPPHKSPLYDSHVVISNCLIGSKKGHEILLQALDLSILRWNEGNLLFPYNDRLSTLYRTLYRTFYSFDLAVETLLESRDESIILPPSFVFDMPLSTTLIKEPLQYKYPIARHQWDNSWFKEVEEIYLPTISKDLVQQIVCFYENIKQLLYFLIGVLLSQVGILVYLKKGSLLCSKPYSLLYLRS